MSIRDGVHRRREPLLLAIVALFCAAVTVIYLEHREHAAQQDARAAIDRQTRIVLKKLSEQAAVAVAHELREVFDGPIFETLSKVNHPSLRAGRLDLVAQDFAEGLAEYPQVERFFIWLVQTEALAPAEVLFYGGHPSEDEWAPRHAVDAATVANGLPSLSGTFGRSLKQFYRDRVFGRQVYEAAAQQQRSQWIYAALEQQVGSSRYHVFVRLFWIDANRERFFAVMGFVVNLNSLQHQFFAEMYRRRLATLLDAGPERPRLELRILDEKGRIVFGPADPPREIVGSADLALQIYPADHIGSRMAAGIPARPWRVVVSPVSTELPAAAARVHGYWLSGVSVLLIFVALVVVVRTNRHALELSRMQTDFVSHVSHQLKTPLSLVSAASETLDLDRVRSPEKLAQYLEIVRTETAHLRALVDRILEFSRVEGRQRSYELEPVSLTPLVRETVAEFQRALEDNAVTITVEQTGPAPVVAADPAALEQVLANLLDNAVKYSRGVKEIVVRVGRVGSDAVLEVQDHGIGIAPDDRRRVFERFYRGTGAALHRQGFGLGLAIVRDLVTAHRGRIELESAVERGTTVRVRLPILKSVQTRDEPTPRVARPDGRGA